MVAFLSWAATVSTTLLALSSPPSSQTTSTLNAPTTEQYSNLLNWLNTTFDSSYVSPTVTISPSPRGGHGLFAQTDIPADTLLVTIPREACITSEIVLNDEDVGKAFQTLMKKAGPGSFTVAMAGYLAKEYLVLKELGSEGTKFGPYFETLPWTRGFNGQDHVLFWSQDDVDTLLVDSLCERESLDLRAEVKVAKRILNALIGPTVLRARNEMEKEEPLIPFLPWTKPPTPTITSPIPGIGKAVSGAFVILLTRAFDDEYDTTVEGEDAERLIPILDMINHDNDPSIRHETSKENGSVEVRTRRNIAAGEEIFNQYREEEELNMPYHRFFSRFGFVPGITENAKALFMDKSSIFFSKKAQV